MLNEIEYWVIGLLPVLSFLVFVNWLQFGHVEGWVGYQHCWKLQSIHIKVGFVNDFIKAHVS